MSVLKGSRNQHNKTEYHLTFDPSEITLLEIGKPKRERKKRNANKIRGGRRGGGGGGNGGSLTYVVVFLI